MPPPEPPADGVQGEPSSGADAGQSAEFVKPPKPPWPKPPVLERPPLPPLEVPPLEDEDVPPDELLVLPLVPVGVLLVPADVLVLVVPALLEELPAEPVPPLSSLLPPHAAESARGSTNTGKLKV